MREGKLRSGEAPGLVFFQLTRTRENRIFGGCPRGAEHTRKAGDPKDGKRFPGQGTAVPCAIKKAVRKTPCAALLATWGSELLLTFFLTE